MKDIINIVGRDADRHYDEVAKMITEMDSHYLRAAMNFILGIVDALRFNLNS